MFANARRAYDRGARTSASGRELEAAALTKAARQLEDCQRDWDQDARPAALDTALRHNQKLWTFLAGEIAAPESPLPRTLRENLLSLARFVDRRTFEMMAAPTREGLQILIDINRHLAAGLATPVPVADPETAVRGG
jgi:flagellar protein FlaF